MSGNVSLKRTIPRQADKGTVDNVRQCERTFAGRSVPAREYENERILAKRKLLDRVWQSGS
jgi:hypothetical protein